MNSRYAQLLPASLGGSGRCRLNGLFEVGCGMVSNMLMTGMAAYGGSPLAVRPIYSRSRQAYVGLAIYNAQAAANGIAFLGAGSLGYLPAGSTYTQGVGIEFQDWFGALWDGGDRFGSAEQASNFLPEKAAQIRGMVFGAQAAQSLPNWPNPPVDVAGVKSVIAGWLSKKPCSDFINGILNRLDKKYKLADGNDILKLFEDVNGDGGFVRGKPPDNLGNVEGGTFRGRINKGATIYLSGFDPKGNPDRTSVNLLDAGAIFHELLHLSTKKPNDDMQLSRIIKDLGYGVDSWPTDKDNSKLAYSKYIHDAIVNYCGTP